MAMTAVTITQITYQELELLIEKSLRKILNNHTMHSSLEPAIHTVRLNSNFSKEQRDMIMKFASSSQNNIDFSVDRLLVDPLKHFKGNSRKAIVDLIKKYKTTPFTGYQITDIKKQYYVPDLQDVFKRIAKRNLMTIESKSQNLKIYQFSEKLCRHFGN
jgi:hypothetical protein